MSFISTSPLVLAVDTATPTVSIALFDGARILVETTWTAGRQHTARLLIEIDHALSLAGRTIDEITGLGAAIGPGSFTGVRAGLSVVQGLAVARDVPVWGADTLCLLVRAAGATALPLRPLVEVGRGRYASALFRDGSQVEPLRGLNVPQVIGMLTEPTLLLGELPADARSELLTCPFAQLPALAAAPRRASYLAVLAWESAQSNSPGDPGQLDALYLPPG